MRNIFFIICLLTCAQLSVAQDTTLICHQDEVTLSPLDNLNSKSIEFSPVYYQGGIVYVVAREKNRFIDPKTGEAYFDLMYADVGPDGTVGKAVSFSPNIRTQYHEGPCTFNANGTELFFTRSNLSGGTGIDDGTGEVQLKIYQSTKGPEDWEDVRALPFSSDQYSVAHPSLSGDGMYMVFSSNMPGGMGGMDLYITDRMAGEWSTPVNLGSIVNSKGNDVFPFWHPNGNLFFASDGRGGEGGLDLYASAWMGETQFSGVQHLDAPFNSVRDDVSILVSDDGTSGYIASDRKPTQGKDDLYAWSSQQSIFCTTLAPMELIHELTVRNEEMQGIENAYVWLIPMTQEGPTDHKEYFSTELVPKSGSEGSFYLKWSVGDTLSKATADAITSSIGRASLFSAPKATYVLVVQHDGYVPYVEVFPQDVLPADVVLKKIAAPSTKCFNTQFVVYNEIGDVLLNGAAVTLDGSCVKGIKLYTDDNGKAMHCIPENCSVKVTIEQEGYAPHAFTFTSEEEELWSVYLKSSEGLTAPPAPIASGTVIVLDNIYYDFNKSEIRKGEAGELIALANQLKKYPDLKIELTSHTDTRGTSEYNMELSQRRSESSKSYLVLLGINASRILTKAAGESQPRNKCLDGVPCSEAEHQFNRRTEVKIINPAEGMQIRYKAAG
jgi:outer membrane protein OmpA-like peptidoglycan-associated protein